MDEGRGNNPGRSNEMSFCRVFSFREVLAYYLIVE